MLFKPYIYLYETELVPIMNSLWLKKKELIDGNMNLYFKIDLLHSSFLKDKNYEVINNQVRIQYKIDEDILAIYDQKLFSKLYDESGLNKWNKYMREKYYMSEFDELIYQILTKSEELIIQIEEELCLPRNCLKKEEIYEIAMAWRFRKG